MRFCTYILMLCQWIQLQEQWTFIYFADLFCGPKMEMKKRHMDKQARCVHLSTLFLFVSNDASDLLVDFDVRFVWRVACCVPAQEVHITENLLD